MAISTIPFYVFYSLFLTSTVLSSPSFPFPSIFNFGDSLSDTGNSATNTRVAPTSCTKPPYGMTYFGTPTGRCSDGRLIIDFLAQAMGEAFLTPYLGQASSSTPATLKGTNFAVVGATALNNTYLVGSGIPTSSNISLEVQLEWFRNMLPHICPKATIQSGRECEVIAKSLFIVGEIGGNDIYYHLLNGKSPRDIDALIPLIILSITSTIQELTRMGASSLLVPGVPPIGCIPGFVFIYSGRDGNDHDPSTGCSKRLNQLARNYNQRLQDELAHLQIRNTASTIIYADYYQAAMRMYRNPSQFGFTNTLEACCGNSTFQPPTCGQEGVFTCSDPSKYLSWDGLHLTEAAYKAIAMELLQGTFACPSFASTCSNETIQGTAAAAEPET